MAWKRADWWARISYDGIPLGLVVRKQLAHEYIYRYRNGLQEKYVYWTGENPQTPEQQAWRGVFAEAVATWQGLPWTFKEIYNLFANRNHLRMSGYNLFIRHYVKERPFLWEK